MWSRGRYRNALIKTNTGSGMGTQISKFHCFLFVHCCRSSPTPLTHFHSSWRSKEVDTQIADECFVPLCPFSLSLSQSKYFWYVGKCIPVNSNLSIDWMALGGCLQQKLSLWLLDPTTSSWRSRKYLDTDGLRFGFSFIYRVVSFGFCSIRNSRIINSTSIYCLPIQSTHSDNYRQQDTRTLTAIDRIEYFLAIYFFRSFPDSHSVSFHMAQS